MSDPFLTQSAVVFDPFGELIDDSVARVYAGDRRARRIGGTVFWSLALEPCPTTLGRDTSPAHRFDALFYAEPASTSAKSALAILAGRIDVADLPVAQTFTTLAAYSAQTVALR